MAWDPVGATWGREGERGYVRGPVRSASGWTPDMAAALTAPLLVIGGEFDQPETRRQTYDRAGSSEKVWVHVDRASHFMLWEKQRGPLHAASIEWLRDATYQGVPAGEFRVDESGTVTPLAPLQLTLPRRSSDRRYARRSTRRYSCAPTEPRQAPRPQSLQLQHVVVEFESLRYRLHIKGILDLEHGRPCGIPSRISVLTGLAPSCAST